MGAKQFVRLLAAVFAVVFGAAGMAGEAVPASPAGNGAVILDTYSYWRVHVTLRPTLFGSQKDAKQDAKGRLAPGSYTWTGPTLAPDNPQTPLPASGWMQPDFDDSVWWRDPGPFYGGEGGGLYGFVRPHHNRWGGMNQPTTIALLCARGKFGVTDPSQVKSLRLGLTFRGGVVIYLNGKEVKRLHLPDGPVDPLTLAEDYPVEATIKDGKPVDSWRGQPKDLVDLRIRKGQDIELPVAGLHRGVNVLAIEIHRCAMPSPVLNLDRLGKNMLWNTVGLLDAKLTAEGAGVAANVRRPKGLQVWNVNPTESVYVTDYGDPNEPLRPVRIVGARNGAFCGQVVVSSTEALRGLGAEMSALTRKGGQEVLPASAVEISWPRATANNEITPKVTFSLGNREYYKNVPVSRFEALEEQPPAEAPVSKAPSGDGAVQSVWLKTKVPGDAAAGVYEGKLTIRAAGAPAAVVPVVLEVHDYRLPDPGDYETWTDFMEMPESLAVQYKVELWSEEHWKLIERSLRLAVGLGNKTLYLPLITGTTTGNKQSLVRWIKDGDAYKHDLSLAERYLDTAQKAGLKPKVVCLQVWDYYVGMNTAPLDGKGGVTKIGTGMYGQLTVKEPQPVKVSGWDPATGKVETISGPRYSDAGAEAFWRPVAEAMREALKKRGLEKGLMLGLAGDYVPPKVAVELWSKLLPETPWVTMSHGMAEKLWGVPVGYSATVWGVRYAVDPAIERRYGWRSPRPVAYFPRYVSSGLLPPAFERVAYEKAICGSVRGVGRQSLDDFARMVNWNTGWGSLTLGPAWLSAGEKGPIASVRLESGREGVQECEARIFIERALTDEALRARLGKELAGKCQAILDERTFCVILADEHGENGLRHSSMPGGPLGYEWFGGGSGWQERSAKLYAAAAEVAKALGGK